MSTYDSHPGTPAKAWAPPKGYQLSPHVVSGLTRAAQWGYRANQSTRGDRGIRFNVPIEDTMAAVRRRMREGS